MTHFLESALWSLCGTLLAYIAEPFTLFSHHERPFWVVFGIVALLVGALWFRYLDKKARL